MTAMRRKMEFKNRNKEKNNNKIRIIDLLIKVFAILHHWDIYPAIILI